MAKTTYPRTESNGDMTWSRVFRSAFNHFITQGWTLRSAILTASAYATKKVGA
jgi:hypothetical protein